MYDSNGQGPTHQLHWRSQPTARVLRVWLLFGSGLVLWQAYPRRTVLVFGPRFALEKAIGVLTPARLKLLHACEQWNASRVFTLLPVGTVY
jgi:hypothetical protein